MAKQKTEPAAEPHLLEYPEQDYAKEKFSDSEIIVVGSNHCWGRAELLEEAIKNASRPQYYVAYIAKRGTGVSEFDGALTFDKGSAPRVIAKRLPKGK